MYCAGLCLPLNNGDFVKDGMILAVRNKNRPEEGGYAKHKK